MLCFNLAAQQRTKIEITGVDWLINFEITTYGNVYDFQMKHRFWFFLWIGQINVSIARLKTKIPRNEFLVEIDSQQQSIMCYSALSWHGKTQLRFIEGFADGQENLLAYRRKKTSVFGVYYFIIFSCIFAIFTSLTISKIVYLIHGTQFPRMSFRELLHLGLLD